MKIELYNRTEESVIRYFNMTQDSEVMKYLPQKLTAVDEALKDYHKTLLPGSTSYGRTIYADGVHVGDIWCYCMQEEEPNGMVSYCVFDKVYWGKGVATAALQLFLREITEKFALKTLGAFTFSANKASIEVLLKNGFAETETFVEDGTESKYFRRILRT